MADMYRPGFGCLKPRHRTCITIAVVKSGNDFFLYLVMERCVFRHIRSALLLLHWLSVGSPTGWVSDNHDSFRYSTRVTCCFQIKLSYFLLSVPRPPLSVSPYSISHRPVRSLALR